LATATGEGNVKHVDELTGGNWSLEVAAQQAGNELLKTFESVLKEQLLEGAEILMDVNGLGSETQMQGIESALKGLTETKSVETRFYLSGVGQFEVKYRGSSAQLAKTLTSVQLGGQSMQIAENLPGYLRVSLATGKRDAAPNTDELYMKYMQDKYKSLNIEQARVQSKELIDKIAAAAASTKLTDEQKKQLYQTQKDLEHNQERVNYAQSELERRKLEMSKVEEQRRQLQANCNASAKRVDTAAKEQASVSESIDQQNQIINQEIAAAQEKQTAARAQLVQGAEAAQAQVRDETTHLKQQVEDAARNSYTAAHNYDNAQANCGVSANDFVNCAQTGAQFARGFAGLF
jgi:hypothetical protein